MHDLHRSSQVRPHWPTLPFGRRPCVAGRLQAMRRCRMIMFLESSCLATRHRYSGRQLNKSLTSLTFSLRPPVGGSPKPHSHTGQYYWLVGKSSVSSFLPRPILFDLTCYSWSVRNRTNMGWHCRPTRPEDYDGHRLLRAPHRVSWHSPFL